MSRSTRNRRRASAGFTLLEVLAAFVIMSLAMGALLQVFGGGFQAVSRAEEHMKAVYIAQSLLAALETGEPLDAGVRTGETDGYTWQVAIEPFEDPTITDETDAPLLTPLVVRATVSWGDGASAIDLTTLRSAPVSDVR